VADETVVNEAGGVLHCRDLHAGGCNINGLFNRSGALRRFDKHRVRAAAVPRLHTRALGPRPGPGPLHLDDGAHGEVDIALRGQWRGVDGGVEKQVVALLEHEGPSMVMAGVVTPRCFALARLMLAPKGSLCLVVLQTDLRCPALLGLQGRFRFGIFSAVLLREGLAVYPPRLAEGGGGGRRRGSAAVWKTTKELAVS